MNNLNHYQRASHQKGFCVLHHGVGKRVSQVFLEPQKVLSRLPDELPASMPHAVGYLSYPNPTLKNQIPEQQFFLFKEKQTLHHSEDSVIEPVGNYRTFGKLEASVTKAQYLKKIKTVKELLAAGEIYQLNYAICFRKKFEGDPYALFLRWIQNSPAAYSAFINAGDHQILSASPERLFKLQHGKLITEPIKGTAPKSERWSASPEGFSDPSTDPNLLELLSSEKERAELDMITDLARNDVGRVCEYGSLKLEKNRAVMELPNLWHTYSKVSGQLRSDVDLSEVVQAMFPGGSITGCPKIRAMHYIEALEALPRNIFTGSIGRLERESSGQLSADFNICIRTALIKDGYVEYWAGGGIVADSDPESEYEECFLKAERFLELL